MTARRQINHEDPSSSGDSVSQRHSSQKHRELKIPQDTMDSYNDDNYPEGGTKGWLCVFGSFMGLVGSLGLMNSTGTFHAYLESHQLRQHRSDETGWIFGLFTFLTFLCGTQVGPIFDARGPRLLVFLGSILVMAMIVGIGFCYDYWQFILTIGIGTSLIFTPSIAAVGHFFHKKRGLATGIAASGGSLGGVVTPLIFESL
ncbi:major facilitator superfamily domain-containing protein [Aspergillus pseudoustus]|uniref:Major facilitator superfamily domain-containing protein n=1 Tax=Aspergillus pseudoustus TaxID=1810923 RepID=A0ABR4K228_9EURO